MVVEGEYEVGEDMKTARGCGLRLSVSRAHFRSSQHQGETMQSKILRLDFENSDSRRRRELMVSGHYKLRFGGRS